MSKNKKPTKGESDKVKGVARKNLTKYIEHIANGDFDKASKVLRAEVERRLDSKFAEFEDKE